MPSPAGHALGAVIAGWLAGSPPRALRALVKQGAILAAIGIAPDLDFLIGRHRSETHSIGAVLLVASLAAAMRWPVAGTRARIWTVVAAAWGSHVLLDAMGADSSPPSGVMALWPLSSDFYKAEWEVFMPIWRRWQAPGFLAHTVTAVAREILLLGPWMAVVFWWRRRTVNRQGLAS